MNSARERAWTTRSPDVVDRVARQLAGEVHLATLSAFHANPALERHVQRRGALVPDRQLAGECGELGLDVDHEPEHVVEQRSDHAAVAPAGSPFVRGVERERGDRFPPDSQHVHVETPRR